MKPRENYLPKRSSLHNECVRVLKARIEAGEWSDTLPGERRIAEILNVGRDTIRLALSELAGDGWIDVGSSGKQRRILKRSVKVKISKIGTWRIGMLSPFPLQQLSPAMLSEVDQVRSILSRRGGVLDFMTPPWYGAPSVARKLSILLETEPHDAWILYRSPKPVQTSFESSRAPCLIRGYPHQGVTLPYMDYDWTAIGRHAVAELWRKGHRRIGVLLPRDGMRGNIAAWQGAVSFREQGVDLLDVWEDGSKQGLIAEMTAILGKSHPPTAFVTLRARQAITLLTWLGTQGLRVPSDISMISLTTDSEMSHLVPSITAYQTDPSFFAKRVARQLELLVNARLGSQRGLLVMPDLVPGGSIAAR